MVKDTCSLHCPRATIFFGCDIQIQQTSRSKGKRPECDPSSFVWRGLIGRNPPERACTPPKREPVVTREGPTGRCIPRICASRVGENAVAAKRTAMAGTRYTKPPLPLRNSKPLRRYSQRYCRNQYCHIPGSRNVKSVAAHFLSPAIGLPLTLIGLALFPCEEGHRLLLVNILWAIYDVEYLALRTNGLTGTDVLGNFFEVAFRWIF